MQLRSMVYTEYKHPQYGARVNLTLIINLVLTPGLAQLLNKYKREATNI